MFVVVRAAGIFGNHQLVAVFPRVTRGGLYADVSRDTRQHDAFNATTAQLEIQIGAVERAPLALYHQ